MKGLHLREFEQLVLLAVASLGEQAYAISVQIELNKRVERKPNISTIHTALYRMEDKGLVESSIGGAEEKRGGKRKRLFKVTNYGFNSLKGARQGSESLLNVLPEISML